MTLQDILRSAMAAKTETQKTVFMDSGDRKKTGSRIYLDAASHAENDIRLSAIGAIQQWVETDDLDDGESFAERLMALMVGVVDANHDGEITDDENAALEVALNGAWDYLEKNGAAEEDISALLNDWDDGAADRIRDLIAQALPEGEDAASEAIDQFVFGQDDQAPMLDAAYRNVVAVRGGKKMRIKKRIAGSVPLSARQKIAIRKARMKSHSAGAMMRRMKSMRLRARSGL